MCFRTRFSTRNWLAGLLLLMIPALLGFSKENQAEYLKTYPVLPKAQVPEIEQGLELDGKMEASFCKAAAKLSPFLPIIGGANGAGPKTEVWIASTKTNLFLAIRCHEKDLKGLLGNKDRSGWEDDAVEIFLRGGNLPSEPYHHFRVNCAGAYEDEYNRSGLWDSDKIKTAAGREDAAWVIEMAIPFSALELPKDKKVLAGPWRLNFIRTRPMHKGDKKPGGAVKVNSVGERYNEESAWSPTETVSSHLPHMFGYIYLESFGGKLSKTDQGPNK